MESQNKYNTVRDEAEQRIKFYESGFITLPELIHSIALLASKLPDIYGSGIVDECTGLRF